MQQWKTTVKERSRSSEAQRWLSDYKFFAEEKVPHGIIKEEALFIASL